MPPDECIEIALWDRFKWGPDQTDRFTSKRLKILFAILEQERVSKNAMELGAPDSRRINQKIATGQRYVPNMDHIPADRRMKIVRKKLGE